MVKFRSALESRLILGRYGAECSAPPVRLSEEPLENFFQIAGWPGDCEEKMMPVLSKLELPGMGIVGTTQHSNGKSVFRVAPERLHVRTQNSEIWNWVSQYAEANNLSALDLSHARTIICLTGGQSRDLLSRLVPIDLDPEIFIPTSFALTGIHNIPVMLHRLSYRTESPAYQLFVPYSWAASVWDLMCEAALPFGYEVH